MWFEFLCPFFLKSLRLLGSGLRPEPRRWLEFLCYANLCILKIGNLTLWNIRIIFLVLEITEFYTPTIYCIRTFQTKLSWNQIKIQSLPWINLTNVFKYESKILFFPSFFEQKFRQISKTANWFHELFLKHDWIFSFSTNEHLK